MGMIEAAFDSQRRQIFLTEDKYRENRANQLALIQLKLEYISETDPISEDYGIYQELLFLESFWIWMLDYTEGVDIAMLAQQVSGLVDKFELWNEISQPYFKFVCESPPLRRKIGSYNTYWSFEAAALAYWLELDAIDADNIVFPHDLLNCANEIRGTEQFTSRGKLFQEAVRLTARDGSVAPQSGL